MRPPCKSHHSRDNTRLRSSRTNLVECGVSDGQWFVERTVLTSGSARLSPGTGSKHRFSSRATSARSSAYGSGKRVAYLLQRHSSLIRSNVRFFLIFARWQILSSDLTILDASIPQSR